MDVLENNFYTCNFLYGGGAKLWKKFREEENGEKLEEIERFEGGRRS